MKKRELERVVDKHVGQMKKFSRAIPGYFVAEDIHELRVSYKKLRAFLRLLHADKFNQSLHIPAKLKSLYHAAGQVRDIQLFLSQIHTGHDSSAPQYRDSLLHQLFENKEKLVKEIEKTDFEDIAKTIRQHLPSNMRDNTIRKFIHGKVAAIHIILLAVERVNDLHSIRKHLKDIIYNIRIFKNQWGMSFPVVAWKSEKYLFDIAERLGDFNDECLALRFLHNDNSTLLPESELQIIQHWRNDRLQKKEEHQLYLMQQVQQLQLVHNFK